MVRSRVREQIHNSPQTAPPAPACAFLEGCGRASWRLINPRRARRAMGALPAASAGACGRPPRGPTAAVFPEPAATGQGAEERCGEPSAWLASVRTAWAWTGSRIHPLAISEPQFTGRAASAATFPCHSHDRRRFGGGVREVWGKGCCRKGRRGGLILGCCALPLVSGERRCFLPPGAIEYPPGRNPLPLQTWVTPHYSVTTPDLAGEHDRYFLCRG